MSQMMDTAMDLEMTLNLIMLNVQNFSDCQVCAVYLKDAAGESLELRAVSGPAGRGPLLPALPVRDAHAGDWSIAGGDRTEPRPRRLLCRRRPRPARGTPNAPARAGPARPLLRLPAPDQHGGPDRDAVRRL